MKKKIIGIFYILFIILTITSVTSVKGNTNYRFDIVNQEVKIVDGMEHRKVNGDMTYGTRNTKQHYNYVDVKNTRTGYHLVSISDYKNNGYGMHSLTTFIEKYERENPNNEVMAAVNGDFYQINDLGESNNTHVVDYEVLVPGNNSSVALVTDYNGKSSFKNTTTDGFELIVFNKDNEIKFREKVSKTNQIPSSNDELSILFDNYSGRLDGELTPIFIKGTDIKTLKPYNGNKTFAKGNKIDKLETTKVPTDHFVVYSEALNSIIEDGDKVLYQAKIKGYENVASAIGTSLSRGPLVVNGKIDPAIWDEAHPRTAIGIKENGDIFFVVVDGRDRLTPKHGVFLSEFAHLMKSLGAVDAYNFDGGGSSTLMIKNDKKEGTVSERFDVLNDLSDGRLRSLSNAYLVVKGDTLAKPVDIRGVENRTPYNVPTNLFIDNDLKLHFDEVEAAERYLVTINGNTFETSKNEIQLKGLSLGENIIKVKVKGTSENSTSESSIISYRIHTTEISSILNLLKKYNK